MTEGHSFISAVFAELARRKVLRTVGAYAVAVFAILQLMEAVAEPLRLPDWLPTLVVVGLILGFPLVFLLAWVFEITARGVRRTRPAGLLTRAQSFALFSAMLLATAGLGFGFYQFYGDELEEGGDGQIAAREFAAPENSIAVLPFTDMSEEGDQASFSDGVAEEILNLLAQVKGLHVAARTSSFAFRNPQKDIREIGRLLNVSTVLEGSLRKSGNRIRLTAQLINVEDGYHIWAESYDRELDDVFAIQDEVASSIASALVDSFTGLERKPASRTRNLAAFEAFRTGRLHWWRRSPREIQQAIELFASALEHDPQFAPAYAAIADSMLLLASYGNITQMRAIERAQPMIEKALAIDPESAEAYAALGLARWQIGQTDSAESALRQAVSLNEDYIPARLWLGGLLGELGRIPEQGLVLQEAMALDPLNELLAINYAGNLYMQGDYQGARELLGELIRLRPDSATLLRTMSNLAVGHGELVEAWKYASRSYELEPESPATIVAMAKAWLELGNLEAAEKVLLEGLDIASDNAELQSQYFFLLLVDGRLEEAERMVKEQFGPDVEALPERFQRFYHFQMGLVHFMRDDLQRARDHLEQAIDREAGQGLDDARVFILTMTALVNQELGNPERAEQHLAEAERAVRRALINGEDHAEVHYDQAILHALRGEKGQAVEELRLAYEKGWRQGWVLKIDGRLALLGDEPGFVEIKQQILEDVSRARAEVRDLKLVRI